jgi:hypothetical protein
MDMFRHRGAAYAFAFVIALAPCAHAQSAAQTADAQALRSAIDDLKKDFEQRLAALEMRLTAVETAEQQRAAAPAAAGAPSAPATSAAPQATAPALAVSPESTTGASVSNAKVFNPDIAVIGDFLGAVGHPNADPSNLIRPLPSLQMHESEGAFQAVVDPYARADFFISFGEEGVDLEEGYLTFTSLPGGLLTKVGKMRAAFGKVNTLHNHVLSWTDRPLVTNNLVGGEDGISDAGISVARLIPNPWFFLEATGQVFRGDSGSDESPLFHATERTHVSYVGHVRGYQDLSESTNIDLGVSVSRGFNDSGFPQGIDNLTTRLFGVDATLRWRPLQRSIYRSFVARSEVIWSRREQPNGVQDSNGFYVSGDYQFARRWFAGIRFDESDRADNASLRDKGGSAILTYWPSEFSQVRGQYRRTHYASGTAADEFLFQFQFSIGAHGAHPF